MNEFRVPTVQVDVEVTCVNGDELSGLVFMPALSAVHAGGMRAEEWVNGPLPFFPFRPRGAGAGMLLNKHQVLALTTSFEPADEAPDLDAEVPVRRVALDAGGHRFEGRLVIDMPINQQRVLDYVNRPDPFLLLHRDDGRQCLVRKDCIARIVELEGA